MNLRSKVLSGVAWTGGARLVSQLLTWGITIVVMRLLNPSDYGLLAMASMFGAFLGLFGQGGLGTALIQATEVDEQKLRRIFGAMILIDVALFLLQYAAAPAIAYFFDEDRLVAIVRVLGLQFLLAAFTSIPGSLLVRRMDFKLMSVIGVVSAVCASLSTLGMALHGYGLWSLVIGNLIGLLLNAIALNVVSPFMKRPDFSFRGLRGLMTFGSQVTASRVLWFFSSQADIFIAGRLLGKELLGFYSVSMHLASLPVQRISSLFNPIAFPAFARTQHDPEAVSRYLLKTMRVLSFFSFPITWGISSIASEIVVILLGPKWQPAVLPLQLIPLVMPLTLLAPTLNAAFQGLGQSKVVFKNMLTGAVLMPCAFLLGSRWGVPGLALAWLTAFPVVFTLNMLRMLPLAGLKFSDLLSAISPAALAAAGMYASVAIARRLAVDALGAPLLIALLIGVGVVSYAALAWMVNRKAVEEVTDLLGLERLRGILQRR